MFFNYKLFLISEKKTQSVWHLLYNNDYANVIKSTGRKQKSAEKQKTSFSKETVKNADSYKPLLNKVMATQKNVWNTVL